MRLFLIRHAKIAGDPYVCPPRPVTGCLSEEIGVPQARALAVRLAGERIDLAFSSPYGRALQTAEIALAGRGVPIRVLDCLREWQPSDALRHATSTVFEEMMERDRGRHVEETWKTDLGEGCYELYARVVPPFLAALAETGLHARLGGYVSDPGKEDLAVAVFAHGGSLNVLLSHLLGVRVYPFGTFAFEETGLAIVEFAERCGVHYPSLRIPRSGGSSA
jgi:broad specificity phosphatase PhoE